VRKEFVSLGQTVNHVFYKDDWVLQHDYAPPHNALTIREFLAKKSFPVLPHPPYSPDLAPCDFYLFPKLKSKLKGHHFRTMENIQKIVTDELNARKMISSAAMMSGKYVGTTV